MGYLRAYLEQHVTFTTSGGGGTFRFKKVGNSESKRVNNHYSVYMKVVDAHGTVLTIVTVDAIDIQNVKKVLDALTTSDTAKESYKAWVVKLGVDPDSKDAELRINMVTMRSIKLVESMLFKFRDSLSKPDSKTLEAELEKVLLPNDESSMFRPPSEDQVNEIVKRIMLKWTMKQ